MTQEILEKVHQHMLMIMDDIHRVCKTNHLKYYMIGGTAIGAVRHKGFIPWDPDIDIAMPREDYEKFLELAPRELNRKLVCHHHRVDKNYYPPHAIVEELGTRMILSTEHLNDILRPHGIYVDVLPLDYVPDSEKERAKQESDLIKIKKWKYRKQAKIYLTDNVITRIIKSVCKILYSPIPWTYLNEKQERIMVRHNQLSSKKLLCSMASHYKYNKLTMESSVFGEPLLYSFEGREYYGPSQMDTYLINLFGDYMKLPPKIEQEELLSIFVDAKFI